MVSIVSMLFVHCLLKCIIVMSHLTFEPLVKLAPVEIKTLEKFEEEVFKI